MAVTLGILFNNWRTFYIAGPVSNDCKCCIVVYSNPAAVAVISTWVELEYFPS